MIRFEFTYVDVLNLQTLIVETKLTINDRVETLSFFTYYLKFSLKDLIETISTFIYNQTGITISIDIGKDRLVSMDEIPILEESYNILLERIETEERNEK